MSNIYIRNIYSPGFSYIRFSFYKTNLALSFSPWLSKDDVGRSRYDAKKYLNTTISDENAATLYLLSKQICEGTLNNPVQHQIQCNKQTMLSFEYDAEKACLIIEKNKEKMVFEFTVHQYRVKETGQIITKTIQSGLLVFAEVLLAYLTAIGADRQLTSQNGTGFSTPQSQVSAW